MQVVIILSGASECPWMTPTDKDYVLQCVDGTLCNWKTHPEKFGCCNSHQGRYKCPKNKPVMCVGRNCAGGRDHCCSSINCKNDQGPRPCNTGTYGYQCYNGIVHRIFLVLSTRIFLYNSSYLST